MREYTKELAELVLNTQYEDIPREVRELAKKHFLDCVGSALAEAAEPRHGIVRRCMCELGVTGDCRTIGWGDRLTVENAGALCGSKAYGWRGESVLLRNLALISGEGPAALHK